MEKEAALHATQKQELSLQFQKERQRLLDENARLRRQLAQQSQQRRHHPNTAPKPSSAGRRPDPKPNASQKRRPDPKPNASQKRAERHATKPRAMTLKQLQDHISAIYVSKETFDRKCRKQSQLQPETMAQHMHAYLNQKYGLKRLVGQAAAAISKAITRFVPTNNDVAVFDQVCTRHSC